MALTPYVLPVENGTDGKLRARKDLHEQAINNSLTALAADVTAASLGLKSAKTWAELSAVVGGGALQKGEVVDDAGTHTDPVVGGTVANKGSYSWSTSPAGWKRTGDLLDTTTILSQVATKAPQTSVDAINAKPLPKAVLHAEYAAIIAADKDDPGRAHVALRHDGSLHPIEGPADKRFICEVTGVSPNREIVVQRVDGVTCTIAGGFEGDAYNPAMVGTKCRYMINRGGQISVCLQEMDPTATLGSSVSWLHQMVGLGQSLILGAYSGPLGSILPAYPGRALMFKSAGIRALDLSHHPVYLNRRQDVATLDHLADAVERTHADYGDTGFARFAVACFNNPNQLSSANHSVLVSTHGIGASGYSRLKKGTVPYINMLVAVRRGFNIAKLLGLTYRIPAVTYSGNEADVDVPAITAAVYSGYMQELQTDVETDIRAIIGGTADVRLIITQLATWTVIPGGTPAVAVGQLMAARANAKIVMAGSQYVSEYAIDGLHKLAIGYRRTFEMIAKSWRSANVGVTQAPFAATGASRSGTTITIATAGGTGNLVIDTTATPLRTNYGIELFQVGGTPTAIQSVNVSGTNIIVTLTVDPGPGAVLTLDIGAAGVPNAKPGTAGAPGTNFRDSGAEPSLDGAPQPLWLCIDRNIPVT